MIENCHAVYQVSRQIRPSQYIQAHTIVKSLVPKYADSDILVLGGKFDAIRKVAEGYTFSFVAKKTILTSDYQDTDFQRSIRRWTCMHGILRKDTSAPTFKMC